MAVIALAAEQAVQSGLTPTRTGSLLTTDTYTFPNDGRVLLHFLKTGAGNATITIVTQATMSGLAVADQTVVVPATTGDVIIGPFDPMTFNDAAGLVTFSSDNVAGLTVSIVHLS